MKTYIFALITAMALTPTSIHAHEPYSTRDIQESKELVQKVVSTMEGINGIGASACTAEGHPAVPGEDYAPCIIIYARTETAAKALATLWTEGSKFDDVFVIVSFSGRIVSQPRATSGN